MTTPTPLTFTPTPFPPCDDPACERCHPAARSVSVSGKSKSLEQVAEMARKAIQKSAIRARAKEMRPALLAHVPASDLNKIAQAHGAHSAERDAEGVLVWIKQSVLVPCRIDPLHPIVDNPIAAPTVGDLIDGLTTPLPAIDISTAGRKMVAVLHHMESAEMPASPDNAIIAALIVDALAALNGRPLPANHIEFAQLATEFATSNPAAIPAAEPAAKPDAATTAATRADFNRALDQLIQTLKAGRATGASVTP